MSQPITRPPAKRRTAAGAAFGWNGCWQRCGSRLFGLSLFFTPFVSFPLPPTRLLARGGNLRIHPRGSGNVRLRDWSSEERRREQRRREAAIETAAVTRRSDSDGDREPVKRFAISASKPQHIRVKYRMRVYTYHASIQRQRAMSVGRCLSACIERMCVHERLLHAHQTRCACSARITMHVLYVFLYASHVYTSYIFS